MKGLRIVFLILIFSLFISNGYSKTALSEDFEDYFPAEIFECFPPSVQGFDTNAMYFNLGVFNFDKTVDASLSQLEDITLIRKNRKFAKLPEPLKEIARLRLAYKEATFEELGKMLEPNLSRAGVSHRFKRIHEIADEIRNS